MPYGFKNGGRQKGVPNRERAGARLRNRVAEGLEERLATFIEKLDSIAASEEAETYCTFFLRCMQIVCPRPPEDTTGEADEHTRSLAERIEELAREAGHDPGKAPQGEE